VVIKYLKEKKEDFSIYNEIDTKTFDEIMANKTIRTVYIFGHGHRFYDKRCKCWRNLR